MVLLLLVVLVIALNHSACGHIALIGVELLVLVMKLLLLLIVQFVLLICIEEWGETCSTHVLTVKRIVLDLWLSLGRRFV